MTKQKIPCDVCASSLKRGWLWIGGADYVHCPQCVGTGLVEVVTSRVQARVRTVFQGGQRPHTEILFPQRTFIGDSPIAGR